MPMLKVVLLSVIILSIAVAAIAIKMFVLKDGEFKKSCSSVDPSTGKPMGCTCGNEDGGESCENRAVS